MVRRILAFFCKYLLLGPLKNFVHEVHSEIPNPIIMKDNASGYRDVYTMARKGTKRDFIQLSSQFPDLNPIGNIWCWIKHQITTKLDKLHCKEMQRTVMEI